MHTAHDDSMADYQRAVEFTRLRLDLAHCLTCDRSVLVVAVHQIYSPETPRQILIWHSLSFVSLDHDGVPRIGFVTAYSSACS